MEILGLFDDEELRIKELDYLSEFLPGWIHLNNQVDFGLEYVSPRMVREYGYPREKILNGGRAFLEEHVHPESTKQLVPLLIDFVQKGDDKQVLSFFQLIRTANSDYRWYYTSLLLLPKSKRTIALTNRLDNIQFFNEKIEGILNENIFMKRNLDKFKRLTRREQEIIRVLIQGKSSIETAELLHISEFTVKTHRRNIYKKLGIRKVTDLIGFANAFDLGN